MANQTSSLSSEYGVIDSIRKMFSPLIKTFNTSTQKNKSFKDTNKDKLATNSTLKNTLLYVIGFLTFVTGLSFGFGTYITFLSVASQFSGILGSLLEWAIIVPSCVFQTVLWTNAYYQPAKLKIEELFSEASAKDRQIEDHLKTAERLFKMATAQKTEPELRKILCNQEDFKSALKSKEQAREYLDKIYQPTIKLFEIERKKEHATAKYDKTTEDYTVKAIKELSKEDKTLSICYAFVSSTLSKQHNIGLSGVNHAEDQKKAGIKLQLISFFKKCIPMILNAMNYISINSFGVFFTFYTVMLTVLFQTKNLATLALPASYMPMMLGILAVGWAAGFICAFFLTSQSFKTFSDKTIDKLAYHMLTDDYQAYARTSKETTSLQMEVIEFLKDQDKKEQGDTWKWLTNRPLLGNTLAFGCALSACIMNYYSGIQAAILLYSLAILLTPGKITSADSLMNATLFQKGFGAYSAFITVLMSTALLLNVATTAKPKSRSEDLRQESNASVFFWSATIFSALGQIFCNCVNTFAPHGILSALRLIKTPCERLFQGLFGIFSMGGAIIVTKLQAEAAEDIIEDGWIPTQKDVSETTEQVKNKLFSFFGQGSEEEKLHAKGAKAA
ncbi:MAG: hypothetical protein VX737_05165 [Pseudomonadota bacterium]|nr:hypothetical protein [Pseudomonadota bacterium]